MRYAGAVRVFCVALHAWNAAGQPSRRILCARYLSQLDPGPPCHTYPRAYLPAPDMMYAIWGTHAHYIRAGIYLFASTELTMVHREGRTAASHRRLGCGRRVARSGRGRRTGTSQKTAVAKLHFWDMGGRSFARPGQRGRSSRAGPR